MPENLNRIGKVSKINYDCGMIEVTYPSLDDSVTDELPVCSFNGEYRMPDIGQEVLVIHLSNGSTAGVVLGPYWNEANRPAVSGKGVYRKEMGPKPGQAYEQYKDGTLEVRGPALRFVCNSGAITAAQMIEMAKQLGVL